MVRSINHIYLDVIHQLESLLPTYSGSAVDHETYALRSCKCKRINEQCKDYTTITVSLCSNHISIIVHYNYDLQSGNYYHSLRVLIIDLFISQNAYHMHPFRHGPATYLDDYGKFAYIAISDIEGYILNIFISNGNHTVISYVL
jgi:hypothetical protein